MKNELVFITINKITGVSSVYHLTEHEFRNKCSGLIDQNYDIYKAQKIGEGKCRAVMFLEWDIKD